MQEHSRCPWKWPKRKHGNGGRVSNIQAKQKGIADKHKKTWNPGLPPSFTANRFPAVYPSIFLCVHDGSATFRTILHCLHHPRNTPLHPPCLCQPTLLSHQHYRNRWGKEGKINDPTELNIYARILYKGLCWIFSIKRMGGFQGIFQKMWIPNLVLLAILRTSKLICPSLWVHYLSSEGNRFTKNLQAQTRNNAVTNCQKPHPPSKPLINFPWGILFLFTDKEGYVAAHMCSVSNSGRFINHIRMLLCMQWAFKNCLLTEQTMTENGTKIKQEKEIFFLPLPDLYGNSWLEGFSPPDVGNTIQ